MKGITTAACGTCNGGQAPMQKVFALGKLGFDYGTRARKAYFVDEFDRVGFGKNPDDAQSFLKFFISRTSPSTDHPFQAVSIS